MHSDPVPDTVALTQAGRATWSSGDFNVIARQTMMIAEDLPTRARANACSISPAAAAMWR